MSTCVTTATLDGVLIITLNRPAVRNALNLAAAVALAAALDRFNDDDNLHLGILTGAGNTFCSGMDLKAFATTGQRPYVGERGFGGLCMAPSAKPLIAAVEGHAVAGGCELALACDLIVAADNAEFGLPEVKRGLVPGSGGMLRLPRHIPYHIAMEWVLTGISITAARAHQVGLVNRLVAPGQALPAALALAHTIAANGPLAVRAAKQVVSRSGDWPIDHMFAHQLPWVTPVFESDDAREGARAFAEKRPPVWQGR